jgi:hypothetical protein
VIDFWITFSGAIPIVKRFMRERPRSLEWQVPEMVQEGALAILSAVSVWWPGHADVVRSAREHLDGRLADLEPEALVVRDVRRVRGVQVAGQARFVGESECGVEQPSADAAALGARMDAHGLQIPRSVAGVNLLQGGAHARECPEGTSG